MATLIQTETKKSGKFSLKRVLLLLALLIFLFGLAGGGYWYYLNMQSNNSSSTPSNQKSASKSASKSATASAAAIVNPVSYEAVFYDSMYDSGIKKGVSHAVSFSYPASWKLVADNTKNKNGGHYYSIAAPSNFKIEISEIPGGVGGSCPDETEPKDLILQSESISLNSQFLYLRYVGSVANAQISKAYLASSNKYSCVLDDYVLLTTKSDSINFSAVLSFAAVATKNDFLSSSELVTAKQILTSLVVKN